MSAMRTIEIDFEVHRAIEMERRSFEDTPNSALRRLLKLGVEPELQIQMSVKGERAWSGKGATLPHGTELRMEYNGTVHSGVIVDGWWNIEGRSFRSPSAAAGGVAVTKSGNETTLDGWRYWEVRRPGDVNWVALASLRNTD